MVGFSFFFSVLAMLFQNKLIHFLGILLTVWDNIWNAYSVSKFEKKNIFKQIIYIYYILH